MIILPDRNIVRTKFLLPVPFAEWREPSQAQPKNMFGHAAREVYFTAQARIAGRGLLWQGHFRDRQDLDEFAWAAATGSLRYDRFIQRLPTPEFNPDVFAHEDITLHFLTTNIITGGASFVVPADSTGVSGLPGEFIDCIGGGGSGGASLTSSTQASGGGGGGWSRVTSGVPLTPSSSVPISVGVGGAGVVQSGTGGGRAGNVGTNTWFNSTSTVLAVGGGAGLGTTVGGNPAGGAGGNAASGVGASKNSGGRGGNCAFANTGSGGGGAAGPSGAGNNGGDPTATSQGTNGGAGDAGAGGAGGAGGFAASGAVNTGPGGAGTEYGTAGSGGGSGGASAPSTTGVSSTGAGGAYGAASGGAMARVTSGTSSKGGDGLIVYRYALSVKSVGFNMPMMGM